MDNLFPDDDDMPLPLSLSNSAGKNSAAEQGLNIPMDWKPTVAEPVPVVRCTATKNNGERCRKWSLRGTTVCIRHGAQLPNVREHANAVVESARMRLVGLADEAIDTLEDLVQPGTGDAIRLKAAESILDRIGVKGAMEMKVEVTTNAAPSETISERLADIAKRLAPKPIEESEELEVIDVVDNEPEVAPDPTPV